MNLTSLSFNPTKDFKDFAESFRRSVLQDEALREFVKRRQGIDPEKDTTPVKEEDILQELDSLGNELEAKEAAPMAAHVRNLASALRNLKIVAENIRDEGGQRPEEEASQRAKTAWAQASVCLDALGGRTHESPSMLETAKTYLKGGQHEDLPEIDRDADDLYDSIQKDPAGKVLLRAGHLAADGLMKGSLLERKATFGNFLYRDHELAKMDRQEEIDFFSEITEETKDILLMSPEEQQKKAGAMAEEYAALQAQLLNKDVWFGKNPEAQQALNGFKASEEIQTLYRKTARDRAYSQTQEASQKYRDEIGARNERNKDRNVSINKLNKEIDRQQAELEKAKQNYEQQCRELEGRIPRGKTQEEATHELQEKTEEPRLVRNRLESTRRTIAMQEQLEKRLAQAMEYPRLADKIQLSPADQRLQEQLEAKRQNLEMLKRLRLKNGELSSGKGRGLNLKLTDSERTQVLKACTGLEKAYAARDNALDELLKQYQKGLSSLKPGDKNLETKKAKLAESYEVSRRELRSKHNGSVEKAQEKVRALEGQGLNDQIAVLFALAEGARLFPGKVSPLSLELFGPMGTRQLDELIHTMQKETDREAEVLRQANPRYFEIKDFLKSPAYLGTQSGDHSVRGYKDWSQEELQQAMEQTQKGIELVKVKLQEEEQLLETNRRIYGEEEEKIKNLPTKKQVEDATAAFYAYRDAEKAVLDATEKSIPKKKEPIRIFTEEELTKIAEDRHLRMTEEKSREIESQVKRDLSFEVEKRFHQQNTMREDFVKTSRARMAAIDLSLKQVGQLQHENSPIRRFYAQRQESYARNQATLQTWENQLTVQNPYPEQVKNRLEELYRQIDAGRKKGHKDTDLFRAMSGALKEARNFLVGENGEENMEKLRNMDAETVNTFRGLMQELNRSAATYETERKKGIHWISSNMHFVRLDLAKNLQNFAADTQTGLTELETVENQRLQECRIAIEAARVQRDAEPEPPATLNEFIRDAYELSRDPQREEKQHSLNQEFREHQQNLQEEQNAIGRQQLKQKLESAQNNRSGEAAEFTAQEKQLNLMYNLQRWGTEMDSMLTGLKNPEIAENAETVKRMRSAAVSVRNLGNISSMKMEDDRYRSENGEDTVKETEQDSRAFMEKLAGMGESLQQLQTAEIMFPEGSPERQRFAYIARQIILESNAAAEQLNLLNPQGEPFKADYSVPQEADAQALQTYRETHHIQTGVLASGETVELGWQMQQREDAVRNMLRDAADGSQQARAALDAAAANLQRRLDRGTLPASAQTELNEMQSVMTVLAEAEKKWNERLTEYGADPARRQEILGQQTLKDMEQLGTWAERTLLPYAEADLAPEQENLNRAEQNSLHQQAREGFVLLTEKLIQWGNYARRQLQTMNPQQEAPQAENLKAIEEPEELKASQEEIAAQKASAAEAEADQTLAAEEARKSKNENEKAADEVAPAEVPEQPVELPEEFEKRKSAMELACMTLQTTLDDMRDHLMNPDGAEEERSQDDLTEAEKEQLAVLEQVSSTLSEYANKDFQLSMGENIAEKKAQTSEEAVREMQDVSRLAVEKLPVLQKAAILPAFAVQLNTGLKKLIEECNAAVEWLKGVQPETSVQAVELPEEALRTEEKDIDTNQAQQQKQEEEELELQKAMEADQNSLREEQQKLEDERKALEEEENRLAQEQAVRLTEKEDTLNILRHPELRTQRLQGIAAAMTLCDQLRDNMDSLELPEGREQKTLSELSEQLQGFSYYADTLDFEQRSEDPKEEKKQEECLTRLASMGKTVYEKALPIVKTMKDPEQQKLLREKLESLAETGNWAADEYHNMNPMAPELEKTVLVREAETKAPVQEEIPVPQQEKQAQAEKASEEPQPAKRQAAVFNRSEMLQLLAWCDTIEKLSNKHFKDRESAIKPAEYALKIVRRTVEEHLPHVDEAGKWSGKELNSDPANYKARLEMTEEDLYEHSGEYFKENFVHKMINNANEMTNYLLPLQNEMVKKFSNFQQENPGMGNEALAEDILQMNEALRGMMQYSKDATREFNKNFENPSDMLELPKLPPRLVFRSEEIRGVDFGKLMDETLKKQSWAAMETVADVWHTLKQPQKPAPEPELDPLKVYVEVQKSLARGTEQSEEYLAKRAAVMRAFDEQKRADKMQQAEDEYRTEYSGYEKRSAEFSKTYDTVQNAYTLAVESSRKLKDNKDILASPKDQMNLYGEMADKLAESVHSMQDLQQKAAQNGTMNRSQQKAFSEAALRLAKLSNYAVQNYNKLAAESKLDIQPIAEIDLTPMETEQSQWKAEEQREAAEKAQASENARKNREERLKKEQEKKLAQKAEIKTLKTTEANLAAEAQTAAFWPWDKLKKWMSDREKEGKAKEYRQYIRNDVKNKQWLQFLSENSDSLQSMANMKGKNWESFSNDLKEHFMKLPDAEREQWGGVRLKMPDGLRDNIEKKAEQNEKTSERKNSAEKGMAPGKR